MRQQFHRSILNNGITVLTESVDFVRSCAVGIFIKAGTRDEDDDSEGIAHFIEHMIFKGTHNRDAAQIVEEIEGFGGALNAYTSKETTCIFARVLHDRVDNILDVFSDLILNSNFKTADLRLERNVVLEELYESEESPAEVSHDEFVAKMFPGHPLGRNILGRRATIKKFNAAKIRDFISKNYSPERLIIVGAGYVDHKYFSQSAEKYFSKLQLQHCPRGYSVPPQPGRKKWLKQRDGGSQCHLLHGRQAWSYDFPRRMEYMLLNAALSAGMSSRLFRNIREKYGFAYSIYSFVDMFSDTGLFGFYAGTDKKHIDNILELVWQQFRDISRNGLKNDEFIRIKKQYEGNILMGAESMYNRMERLGRNEIQFQKFISYDESLQKIADIRASDVQQLAQELFDESSFHSYILI